MALLPNLMRPLKIWMAEKDKQTKIGEYLSSLNTHDCKWSLGSLNCCVTCMKENVRWAYMRQHNIGNTDAAMVTNLEEEMRSP